MRDVLEHVQSRPCLRGLEELKCYKIVTHPLEPTARSYHKILTYLKIHVILLHSSWIRVSWFIFVNSPTLWLMAQSVKSVLRQRDSSNFSPSLLLILCSNVLHKLHNTSQFVMVNHWVTCSCFKTSAGLQQRSPQIYNRKSPVLCLNLDEHGVAISSTFSHQKLKVDNRNAVYQILRCLKLVTATVSDACVKPFTLFTLSKEKFYLSKRIPVCQAEVPRFSVLLDLNYN